jgi:AcrR family transcriptional regulator
VTRWEPNTPERLQQAALELFSQHGFERTTVEDIAVRAGLTKRTFFRHFSDKREVLFGGGDAFKETFVNALAAAPADLAPIDAVAQSLAAVGAWFEGRHAFARQRHLVIAANAELQERELIKLAACAAELAAGLRRRGVDEPEASLTAEAGMAVFRIAFERWVTAVEERDLRDVILEVLQTLRLLAAGAPAS